MSESKMGENETVEHIRNEGDKNEDKSEIDCDKSSNKRSWVWTHFIE